MLNAPSRLAEAFLSFEARSQPLSRALAPLRSRGTGALSGARPSRVGPARAAPRAAGDAAPRGVRG